MANWYKIARRMHIPRMEQTQDEREPTDITRPTPFFGSNERQTGDGIGYPRDISSKPTEGDEGYTEKHQLPAGRTILDDDITSRTESDDRFTDDAEKPVKPKREPTGPHNMQRGGVFDNVARKTKLRGINRL